MTSRETLLTNTLGARVSFRYAPPADCCFERVAIWGAIDARRPVDADGDRIPDRPQVAFRVDYSAPRKLKVGGMVCLPAGSVCVPMQVRICGRATAPTWTLRRLRRLMPNYGGATATTELWPSHFTLPIAQFKDLRADGNTIRGPDLQGGEASTGFRSTSNGVLPDGYGRNVYLDVLNGPYGLGWRRENSS